MSARSSGRSTAPPGPPVSRAATAPAQRAGSAPNAPNRGTQKSNENPVFQRKVSADVLPSWSAPQ